MPIASGLSAAMRRMISPCHARGNGHCLFSSMNDGSSMVTMTTGASGVCVPRTSKNFSSDQYSTPSSAPVATATTTARAPARPGR